MEDLSSTRQTKHSLKHLEYEFSDRYMEHASHDTDVETLSLPLQSTAKNEEDQAINEVREYPSPDVSMENLSKDKHYPSPYKAPASSEATEYATHSTELPSPTVHPAPTEHTKYLSKQGEFSDIHKEHPSLMTNTYEYAALSSTPDYDYALDLDSMLNIYSRKNLQSPHMD